MTLKAVPFNVALTFSRPAPADYEDINGDTQTAGVDVPRFNYSAGVAEGLLLDASISETAAINDIPNFNASEGTWVINADLEGSMPIPGSGFGQFLQGSGYVVFVYSAGVGKCWADGEVLFTVDPFIATEPGYISDSGFAKIKDVTYYPYAWPDSEAEEAAIGVFSLYFGPELLFADGTDGFWGDSTDTSVLFEGADGTDPAVVGEFCGLRLDKSGNGNDQYQTTSASKPTVAIVDGVQCLQYDDDDDSMVIDVPAGGWAGTFVQGTAQGVIVGEIAAPEGPYQIPTDPNFAGPGTDVHTVLVNRVLTDAELERLVDWVGERVPVADFSGVMGVNGYFRNRSDITMLDCSAWEPVVTTLATFAFDMPELRTLYGGRLGSSATSGFGTFCRLSDSLETLVINDWVTSGATTFLDFARDCTALTNVTVLGGTGSPFRDSPCTDYRRAFQNTNLSQQSYTDILTEIEAAGTSNGELDITGGSATTTGAAQTALDALRARGWAVTTPDGY